MQKTFQRIKGAVKNQALKKTGSRAAPGNKTQWQGLWGFTRRGWAPAAFDACILKIRCRFPGVRFLAELRSWAHLFWWRVGPLDAETPRTACDGQAVSPQGDVCLEVEGLPSSRCPLWLCSGIFWMSHESSTLILMGTLCWERGAVSYPDSYAPHCLVQRVGVQRLL